MPLKSDYNHIICVMEGETKNIRFVLKIYRFVLRLTNISFCGLYLFSYRMQGNERFVVGLCSFLTDVFSTVCRHPDMVWIQVT